MLQFPNFSGAPPPNPRNKSKPIDASYLDFLETSDTACYESKVSDAFYSPVFFIDRNFVTDQILIEKPEKNPDFVKMEKKTLQTPKTFLACR